MFEGLKSFALSAGCLVIGKYLQVSWCMVSSGTSVWFSFGEVANTCDKIMHEFEKCHALLLMMIDKHLVGIQNSLAKEPQGKFLIPLVGFP